MYKDETTHLGEIDGVRNYINSNGEYSWTIDNSYDPGTYHIELRAMSSLYDISDNTFSLVTSINQPPTSQSASYSIPDNYESKFELFGEDDNLASNFLTFSIVDQPSNGTINISGNIVTYNPGSFSGTDSFTYKVNDGVKDSDVATISLNVINSLVEELTGDLSESSVGGRGYRYSAAKISNSNLLAYSERPRFYQYDENGTELSVNTLKVTHLMVVLKMLSFII